MKVLTLASNYEPIGVIDWHRAIALMFSGKVHVLSESDAVVSSPSVQIKVPSVIVFKNTKFNKNKSVRFSRKNVWIRDSGRCQYCNCRVSSKEFTLDHVVPRTLGGKTMWTNVVTCCVKCNQKKADKPLHKSGMQLIKPPNKPMTLPYSQDVDDCYEFKSSMPEDWKFWLGDKA